MLAALVLAPVTAVQGGDGETPSEPTAFSATPHGGRIDLAWAPPQEGAGSVTAYVVQRQSGIDWPDLATLGGAARAYSDTTVTDGTRYCYRALAENEQGRGPATSARWCVVANAVPSEPQDLTVVVSADGQVLRWYAPRFSGDAEVGGYRVCWSPAPVGLETCEDASVIADSSGMFTYRHTGANAGLPVSCYHVHAVNAHGAGPASAQACSLRVL